MVKTNVKSGMRVGKSGLIVKVKEFLTNSKKKRVKTKTINKKIQILNVYKVTFIDSNNRSRRVHVAAKTKNEALLYLFEKFDEPMHDMTVKNVGSLFK